MSYPREGVKPSGWGGSAWAVVEGDVRTANRPEENARATGTGTAVHKRLHLGSSNYLGANSSVNTPTPPLAAVAGAKAVQRLPGVWPVLGRLEDSCRVAPQPQGEETP